MNNIRKWVSGNRIFLVGLIISIGLLWPLFVAPYFTHHDDVQVIRLYEMNKCITDGQIPCRWVPDLGGLYGYPLFNYYAPFPYYFGEFIYLLSGSLIFSAKVMFAIAFIGSFIFMFFLGRRLWGDMGGLISGVFYSFAPYHALDLYVRGAMEELWGLMFFPAVFWAILRLRETTKVYNALILALFFALLVLSHNISAMLFIPLSIAFIGVIFYQRKDFRFLKLIGAASVLGALISAFYWLPMIVENNLVHVETLTGGYFSYTEHFKGIKKLFVERMWGWGASVREIPGAERDGMSFQIGWIHLLGWFLSLITAQYLWRRNKQISILIIFFSATAAISVFMVHPWSKLVWDLIEPLKYVQFPWRFLALITFFVSLLSGSILLRVQPKKQAILAAILVVLVIAANFTYFRPEKFLQVSESELLTGENWDKQIKRSIFDFLPIYAQEPPAELAASRYEVVVGNAKIRDYKEGTNWFEFTAKTDGHTILRLSKYYFPNWRVFVNGQEAVIEYKNNHLGLITLILGSGNYQITGRLEDTTIRSSSNLATILGITILILLIPTQIPKTRRWITYYLKALNR